MAVYQRKVLAAGAVTIAVIALALLASGRNDSDEIDVLAALSDARRVELVIDRCNKCLNAGLEGCPERDACIEGVTSKLPYALANAISTQRMDVVKVIVEKSSMDINARIADSYDETALHIAAYYNGEKDIQILKYLLDKGADVNAIGRAHARTPLLTAIWKKNNVGARLLLQHGADPSIVGDRSLDACAYASRWDNYDILKDIPGCCQAIKIRPGNVQKEIGSACN